MPGLLLLAASVGGLVIMAPRRQDILMLLL
jgi:hypothetical protein